VERETGVDLGIVSGDRFSLSDRTTHGSSGERLDNRIDKSVLHNDRLERLRDYYLVEEEKYQAVWIHQSLGNRLESVAGDWAPARPRGTGSRETGERLWSPQLAGLSLGDSSLLGCPRRLGYVGGRWC